MLKYRFLSGVALAGALILAARHLPSVGILFLLLAVCALALREFYDLVARGGVPVFRGVGTLCGSVLIAATWGAAGPGPGAAASVAWWQQGVLTASLLAVFLRQFPQRHNAQPLATIGATLFGFWYVGYLLNFFTLLAFGWEPVNWLQPMGTTGRRLIFFLVLVVKASDSGAYFVGRWIGRHKMIPRISPGKTWEGLAGGLAAGMASGVAFQACVGGDLGVFQLNVPHAAALGLLLSVAAVAGDLFESLLKRAASLKDSSQVVPGMGGLLDVLDSLLFGAPVLYLYARWVLP